MSENPISAFTANSLLTDFRSSLSGERGPSEAFFELIKRLASRFSISKAVLLLRPHSEAPLAAVSTWNNGQVREGLSIKLPSESSLFEIVAGQGDVYTENFCASFSGNFFEKKLLLEDDSRSFVLQPLKHDGAVIGLLGFSSDEPTAFSMFEEGTVEPVFSEFARMISEKAWHI